MSSKVLCKGDMLLNSARNDCSRCEAQLFEAAYRTQAKSPVFIVDDALLKGADGEYFHLATRTAFKFFKAGRESWTN